MSTFSETSFIKKLTELNPSQQSIQTLSLWLIHHRKHAKTIVEIWMKEIKKMKTPKKLTFLYLANDVIQNSKKKGPEFNKMFRYVLPDAYKVALKEADDKMRGSMDRMIAIWKERAVFDDETTDKLRKAMDTVKKDPESAGQPADTSKAAEVTPTAPTATKEAAKAPTPVKTSTKPEKHKASGSVKKSSEKKKRKVELTLREEIELEVKNGGTSVQPPEASDLVKALQDLDNSASSDAAVREKIAALPPEVSDASRLDKVTDKSSSDALTGTVDDACSILSAYNSRLADELQERRRVAKMLKEYITAQKQGMAESEAKLADYKSRIDKVSTVRKELKSHIQSLPDLTLLPQVTGGLAPLPSAGDLFSVEQAMSS